MQSEHGKCDYLLDTKFKYTINLLHNADMAILPVTSETIFGM